MFKSSKKKKEVAKLIREGKELYDSGQYRYASFSFEQAVALNSKSVDAHLGLGYSYLGIASETSSSSSITNVRKAEEAFRNTMKLGVRSADAQCGIFRASLLKDLGGVTLAEVKALTFNSKSINTHYIHGLFALELDKAEEALAAFSIAIKLEPGWFSISEAYCGMGKALLKLDKPDEALESFNRGLELDPICTEAYLGKASALQDLKEFKEAHNNLMLALELKPHLPSIYEQISDVMDKLGMHKDSQYFNSAYYEVAGIDFRVTGILDIGDRVSHGNKEMGNNFRLFRFFKFALEEYEGALEQCQEYEKAEIFALLGQTLWDLERYEDSLIAFKNAEHELATSKSFNVMKGFIDCGIAKALYSLTRYDEALEYCTKAPNFVETKVIKGKILFDRNVDLVDAMTVFESASKYTPIWKITGYNLLEELSNSSPKTNKLVQHILSKDMPALRDKLEAEKASVSETDEVVKQKDSKKQKEPLKDPPDETEFTQEHSTMLAKLMEIGFDKLTAPIAEIQKLDLSAESGIMEVVAGLQFQIRQHQSALGQVQEDLGRDSQTIAMVKVIKSHPALQAYYNNCRLALNQMFIASMAISSGKIDRSKSETSEKLVKVVNLVGSFIPFVGGASGILCELADMACDKHYSGKLAKLSKFAVDPVQSARLSEALARFFTLEQKDLLLKQDAKVQEKKPSSLGAKLVKFLHHAISEEDKQAQKAKSDAAEILAYVMDKDSPMGSNILEQAKEIVTEVLGTCLVFEQSFEVDVVAVSSSKSLTVTTSSNVAEACVKGTPGKRKSAILQEQLLEMQQKMQEMEKEAARQKKREMEMLQNQERMEKELSEIKKANNTDKDVTVSSPGGSQAQLLASKNSFGIASKAEANEIHLLQQRVADLEQFAEHAGSSLVEVREHTGLPGENKETPHHAPEHQVIKEELLGDSNLL